MVGDINLFDNRFNYPYKGFCSIVNQVIDLCDYHIKKYDNYDFNISDNQIEELFYVPKNNSSEKYDVGFYLLNDYFSGLFRPEYDAHKEFNINDLKHKHDIFNKTFKIKQDITSKILEVKKNLIKDDNYIGVQIRGTDKKTEIPVISLENIFKHIDFEVINTDKKIFLATDDFFYVENFIKRYGENNIIYNKNNIISINTKPIHFTNNRTLINTQVISDIFILSKSEYFFYTFSNVSYLTAILGINNFKKMVNLNRII